jgi:MFS family permease
MNHPTSSSSPAAVQPLTPQQWVICAVAALGFAFDTYELLMLPLVVRPALMELGGLVPGSPESNQWTGLLFYVPAVCGGVFGLLGGYLTDLLGRRRVLVWSILLYGFSAMATGFATTPLQFLVFRCMTFVGVCVEFVAAVAWLAELFPDRNQRERVLGYTQAFSSVGGLMVTAAYFIVVTYGESFPAIYGAHEAWRYTLISGVIPAFPLMVIRPFLPESPAWIEKRQAGTLRRPSFGELFTPALRQTTIVTCAMMACAYAAAFGAIQQMPRVVPGLPELQGAERTVVEQTVSGVQFAQEIGGLAGRVAVATLTVIIVARRRLLRIFQVPGLVLLPIVFAFAPFGSVTFARWGILLVGFMTVAQFNFWGNYLPYAYPTHLRGTGESFAANVGGRMIGTSAAYITTTLATDMPGANAAIQLGYASAIVGTAAYLLGFILSFWLPEPKQDRLMD